MKNPFTKNKKSGLLIVIIIFNDVAKLLFLSILAKEYANFLVPSKRADQNKHGIFSEFIGDQTRTNEQGRRKDFLSEQCGKYIPILVLVYHCVIYQASRTE